MFFLCTYKATDTGVLFGVRDPINPQNNTVAPDLGIVVVGQAPDCSSYLALAKTSNNKLKKQTSIPEGYDFIFRQSWGLTINEEIIHRVVSTLRAEAYPPMADYIDGIVKGNDTQVQTYIAACLAVKEKYPLFSF